MIMDYFAVLPLWCQIVLGFIWSSVAIVGISLPICKFYNYIIIKMSEMFCNRNRHYKLKQDMYRSPATNLSVR